MVQWKPVGVSGSQWGSVEVSGAKWGTVSFSGGQWEFLGSMYAREDVLCSASNRCCEKSVLVGGNLFMHPHDQSNASRAYRRGAHAWLHSWDSCRTRGTGIGRMVLLLCWRLRRGRNVYLGYSSHQQLTTNERSEGNGSAAPHQLQHQHHQRGEVCGVPVLLLAPSLDSGRGQ